jgi:hypothetical protein
VFLVIHTLNAHSFPEECVPVEFRNVGANVQCVGRN